MGRGRIKSQTAFLFQQPDRKNEVSFTEVEKICGEIGFYGKKQEFSFVHIKFEMLEKHPHGVVK